MKTTRTILAQTWRCAGCKKKVNRSKLDAKCKDCGSEYIETEGFKEVKQTSCSICGVEFPEDWGGNMCLRCDDKYYDAMLEMAELRAGREE